MAVWSHVEKDSKLCPGPLGKKGLDLITTVYPVLTSFSIYTYSKHVSTKVWPGMGVKAQRTRDAAF